MIFWGTVIIAFVLLVLPTILVLVALSRINKLRNDVTFTRRNLFDELRTSERGIKQDTMLQAAQTNRLLKQVIDSQPIVESYILNQHVKTRTVLGDVLKRFVVPVELATAAFTAEMKRMRDVQAGTKAPETKKEYTYSTGASRQTSALLPDSRYAVKKKKTTKK